MRSDPAGRPVSVAFPYIDRRIWQGGYNYLLNLFSAVDALGEGGVRPVLFAGDDLDAADTRPFAALPTVTVVRAPHFNASNKTRRQIRSILFGKDSGAEAHYHRQGIGLIFENAFYHGRRMTIPALVWIPDFQHRHLAGMFSRRQFWKRELGFRMQLSGRRPVLLSSEDAKRDLGRFYPKHRGRAFVLPFSVTVPPVALSEDPARVRERYSLPARFFYLPNQFYRHKNHLLVVEALRILEERGLRPVVAASGNPFDPLASDVMRQIRARITQYRLADRFIILGTIPYPHVIGLMRCADALINPSLSEGWSTTVEEAKTLGRKMILSDLDVHREQAGAFADYFKRNDPRDLADALARALAVSPASAPLASGAVAATGRENRKAFAAGFGRIASECVTVRRGAL